MLNLGAHFTVKNFFKRERVVQYIKGQGQVVFIYANDVTWQLIHSHMQTS